MNHLANRIQDSIKTSFPRCPSCGGKLEPPVKLGDDIMSECLHCYISWPLIIGLNGYEIAKTKWRDPTHMIIARECGL